MARRVSPEPPKPKPFTLLPRPRIVVGGFPSDLTTWYQRHEGIGSDGPTIHHVRLCTLAELKPLGAGDLGLADEPAWAGFRGLHIAQAAVDARIIYTLAGQAYRFGTVFAFTPLARVVLDVNFVGWLKRLEGDNWIEWGLDRDGWKGLQRGKSEALRRHFDRMDQLAASAARTAPDA